MEVDEGILSFLSCILELSVCIVGIDRVYQGRLRTCTMSHPRNATQYLSHCASHPPSFPSPVPSFPPLPSLCAADNLPLDSLLPSQCLKGAVSLGGDGYEAHPSSAAAGAAV